MRRVVAALAALAIVLVLGLSARRGTSPTPDDPSGPGTAAPSTAAAKARPALAPSQATTPPSFLDGVTPEIHDSGRPVFDALFNALRQRRLAQRKRMSASGRPLDRPEVYFAPEEELHALGYQVEQSYRGRFYDTRCVTAPDGDRRCSRSVYPYSFLELVGW